MRRRLAADNAALGAVKETDEGSTHRRRVTVLLNPTCPRSAVIANLLQTEPGCSGETPPEQTAGMQLRLIVGKKSLGFEAEMQSGRDADGRLRLTREESYAENEKDKNFGRTGQRDRGNEERKETGIR